MDASEDIYVKYDKSLTFVSPCCGVETQKKHHQQPRRWRSLDNNNYKVFINMDLPYFKYPKCGKIHAHVVPWAEN